MFGALQTFEQVQQFQRQLPSQVLDIKGLQTTVMHVSIENLMAIIGVVIAVLTLLTGVYAWLFKQYYGQERDIEVGRERADNVSRSQR